MFPVHLTHPLLTLPSLTRTTTKNHRNQQSHHQLSLEPTKPSQKNKSSEKKITQTNQNPSHRFATHFIKTHLFHWRTSQLKFHPRPSTHKPTSSIDKSVRVSQKQQTHSPTKPSSNYPRPPTHKPTLSAFSASPWFRHSPSRLPKPNLGPLKPDLASSWFFWSAMAPSLPRP